ncbi:MAG: acyl-CoA dehydrogenase family protein [Miltoncostaeaceae bacterium]
MLTPDRHDLYLTDALLDDRDAALREAVRRYCDEEVRPIINGCWERAEFPVAALPGLARLGIVGGTIAGHGAPGLSARAAGVAAMELARCDGSLSTFFGVQSGLVMRAIHMHGSEEQRRRWLPGLARLELIGSFALTEPHHGSDAVALETSARRDGAGWRLSGHKRWIGNATFADLLVVWARDEATGEVGAWVVPGGAEGLEARPITGKIGKRASVQADIVLDGVPVADEDRLRGADGFAAAAAVLTKARSGVAWAALGHARAALEIAIEHTCRRSSFGRPLAGHQIVQATLAKMTATVTGMALMCHRLAELETDEPADAARASLAKMHNAGAAREVVGAARELLGGDGLLLENDVARHLTDVEVTVTVEGTEAIQALIVGRELTGLSAFGGAD